MQALLVELTSVLIYLYSWHGVKHEKPTVDSQQTAVDRLKEMCNPITPRLRMQGLHGDMLNVQIILILS